MSRVGKNPITLPANISVDIVGNELNFKSQKGSHTHTLHAAVKVLQEGQILSFQAQDDSRLSNALTGTHRALVNNVVIGLSEGFTLKLELVGVGYRAQVQGNMLNLTLGYSHPVNYEIPAGVSIEAPSQTEIIIKGTDKQKVGQVAANICAYRKVDVYKGKGIRKSGQVIKLKEIKKK